MSEHTATQAKRRLKDIRGRLEFIATNGDTAWDAGPLRMAITELTLKMAKRPEDLEKSSKLYRCIDAIETARAALADIAQELRGASGWKPGE